MSVVRPIDSVPDDKPDVCDLNQVKGGRQTVNGGASSAAATDSKKLLVHEGIPCFGENCAHRWTQPIIGVRYECLSCKKIRRSHNFCASCYETYPYKSKTLVETLGEDEAQVAKAGTVQTDIVFLSASNQKRQESGKTHQNPTVEHLFRCVSLPSAKSYEPEKLYDQQTIDKKFQVKSKGDFLKRAAEFSHTEFVVLGILFYPFGVMNLLLHRIFSKPLRVVSGNTKGDDCTETNNKFASGPLHLYLKKTQNWAIYFAKLPWISVGLCLVINFAAIVGIDAYQSKSGRTAALYWKFVYEIFFLQSLTVQVQLFMVETNKSGIVIFVLGTVTGISLINQWLVISVGSSDVYSLALYERGNNKKCQTKNSDSHRFVFPAPLLIDSYDNEGVDGEASEIPWCSLDPAKVSLWKSSKSKVGTIKLVATMLVMGFFALLIMFVSVVSMDTSLMVYLFGEQIRLPEMVDYDISHSTNIVSGCNNGDQPVARVLLGLQLFPVPTAIRGLPQLTLSFINVNASYDLVPKLSVEAFWYVDLVGSTTDSIQLQVLENHDYIPLIVSFPNTNCSTLPYLSLSTRQKYPDSLQGLNELRYLRTSDWILAFYFLIAAPSIIVSTCFRALAVCLGIATTWEVWDAFKSFTEPSDSSGVWSPDHMARLQIDFSVVQNCRAWYELRKHLCEITNINLRTAIPMLRIAVIQFVLALAAVCWYAVVGEAPIPGFAYLICLCLNSLVVLMFSVPLTLIWRMQFGHIAMIATKLRQVEMLPSTTNIIRAEEQRQAARVLSAIKTELEVSDKRVAVLGIELSPGFLQTIATFAATGISFLLGSNIQYKVTDI